LATRKIRKTIPDRARGVAEATEARPPLRSLHVIAGGPDSSLMIFARRESVSLRHAGISVRQFFLASRTSPIDLLREFFRLRREIREFRPHVIHAHYGTVTALFSGLATSGPLVVTFRGSDLNPTPTINRWRSLTGRFFSQLAALRASEIICVTTGLKHRLWWRQDRVSVMPGGIDLESFRPRPRDEARAALGWPVTEKIILFNAGKAPTIKRLDLAEAAVEEANRNGCRTRMVVLNGDTDPDAIPLYLNAADCLLITSDWEGSPYIVKEALGCDLPVVSVDVGDVRERVAGVSPSRIVERHRDALGAALAEVLSFGCRSNGHLAMQELSEAKVAERIRSIYERAVFPKHRGVAVENEKLLKNPEAGRA
jgi:teichuronic acid biosynthesis glycosyltransferase TuaC